MQVLAETNANWRNGNEHSIQDLLSQAAQKDKDQRLSLKSLVTVIGKYDFIEKHKLLVPEQKVYALRGGAEIALKTEEFVWKLSMDRRLQAVVAEAYIAYAFIIDKNKKKTLVWK